MSLSGTAWLFAVGAWALGVAGGLLLLWAIWGDWARGVVGRFRTGARRRRCPKCWYDMGGVQTLTCPECGCDAKRERRLLRSRRRWLLTLPALVLLLLANVVRLGPVMQRDGWAAGVPTIALIVMTPWLDAESAVTLQAVGALGGSVPFVRPGGRVPVPASVTKPSVASVLVAELDDRANKSRAAIPRWQWWFFVRQSALLTLHQREGPGAQQIARMYQIGRSRGAITAADELWLGQRVCDHITVRTRARWVEGEPAYASVELPAWLQHAGFTAWPAPGPATNLPASQPPAPRARSTIGGAVWEDGRVAMGVIARESRQVICHVVLSGPPFSPRSSQTPDDAHKFWRSTRTLPVKPAATALEILEVVPSPAVPAVFEDYGETMLTITASEVTVWTPPLSLGKVLRRERLTMGVECDLLVDGEVVGTTRAWWAGESAAGSARRTFWAGNGFVFPLAKGIDRPHERTITLRLRGCPAAALRDFGATRAWVGEITLPTRVQGWLRESDGPAK